MYNVGVRDDKLNLLYKSDQKNNVAVKTPSGLTERFEITDTVSQGDVNQSDIKKVP